MSYPSTTCAIFDVTSKVRDVSICRDVQGTVADDKFVFFAVTDTSLPCKKGYSPRRFEPTTLLKVEHSAADLRRKSKHERMKER